MDVQVLERVRPCDFAASESFNTSSPDADGTLKFWEVDTGHHVASLTHHKGWVTDLSYWYSNTNTCSHRW